MKARLARKLVNTPIHRLSPYWRLQLSKVGIRDHRIMRAFTKAHGGTYVQELIELTNKKTI